MATQNQLVLCLGNPLCGDDGVGAAVLARLDECQLSDDIILTDGGIAGLETVLLLQGYQRVIIIDAADMALAPGSWRRFRSDEVMLGDSDMETTLHSAGLAEALTLGAALDLLPNEIIIYGIQPTSTDFQLGLSSAVDASIPAVISAIVDDLG